MGFNRKTWKARLGIGLNKFSMNGGTPVPFDNKPDGLYQEGDYISPENLNDLEQRIYDEDHSLGSQITNEATARENADTALRNAISNLFIVRGFNISSTNKTYGQVDCRVDGYTPIGVVGHYLTSDSQYFRGRRLYTSGGVTYARILWWNINQETYGGNVYVLYIKNDLV